MTSNVILIGYRGSGKTSIGRILAEKLWKTFVDVDERVCAKFNGQSIAQIWQTHGQAAFRAAEREVTCELCQGKEQVIGLGGGSLLDRQAREAVQRAEAIRIYLKCEPAELYRRIQHDTASAASRPNLTDLGGGVQEIEAVLREREPVYLIVADSVFDVTHVTPEAATDFLLKLHV